MLNTQKKKVNQQQQQSKYTPSRIATKQSLSQTRSGATVND